MRKGLQASVERFLTQAGKREKCTFLSSDGMETATCAFAFWYFISSIPFINYCRGDKKEATRVCLLKSGDYSQNEEQELDDVEECVLYVLKFGFQ